MALLGRSALSGLLCASRGSVPCLTRSLTLSRLTNTGSSRLLHTSSFHLTTLQPSISPIVRSATRSRSPSTPTPTISTETESSVARGTRYELLCSAVLRSIFGMELERTGGAGDRGIDLRGWWASPSLNPSGGKEGRRIRVVAQCKCQDEGGKKMGPVLVREIEGVVFRASLPTAVSPLPTFVRVSEGDEENPTAETQADESADAPVAGIILSSSGFSTQALLQVRSSSVPLAAMHVLAQPADGNGADEKLMQRCVSIIWNDRFGSSTGGLLEGGMEVRWGREFGGNSGAPGRPVIYRGGRPLR